MGKLNMVAARLVGLLQRPAIVAALAPFLTALAPAPMNVGAALPEVEGGWPPMEYGGRGLVSSMLALPWSRPGCPPLCVGLPQGQTTAIWGLSGGPWPGLLGSLRVLKYPYCHQMTTQTHPRGDSITMVISPCPCMQPCPDGEALEDALYHI